MSKSKRSSFVFAFEQLDVWRKAMDFADYVLSIAENLESSTNHYRLIAQLEAACTSISLNIAEGKGRYSRKEYIHHLYIARGSVYETVTIAKIFHKRNRIESTQSKKIQEDASEIVAMIKGLINALSTN